MAFFLIDSLRKTSFEVIYVIDVYLFTGNLLASIFTKYVLLAELILNFLKNYKKPARKKLYLLFPEFNMSYR